MTKTVHIYICPNIDCVKFNEINPQKIPTAASMSLLTGSTWDYYIKQPDRSKQIELTPREILFFDTG